VRRQRIGEKGAQAVDAPILPFPHADRHRLVHDTLNPKFVFCSPSAIE
jgi:hypothetical protein